MAFNSSKMLAIHERKRWEEAVLKMQFLRLCSPSCSTLVQILTSVLDNIKEAVPDTAIKKVLLVATGLLKYDNMKRPYFLKMGGRTSGHISCAWFRKVAEPIAMIQSFAVFSNMIV